MWVWLVGVSIGDYVVNLAKKLVIFSQLLKVCISH